MLDDLQYRHIELKGIKIRPNIRIGDAIGIDDLFRDGYKAIFIGTGVWRANTLHIKGETLGNVHFAINYLTNPDVKVLMFAPITRTFAEAFPDTFKVKQVPEYKTNKFSMHADVDNNLSYLYAWEQVYDGDVVDFDYHLMWDHILDAGGEGIAKILHQDIRNFKALGINGFISCQLQ